MKVINFIKKYSGQLLILFGVGIFVYSVFNFSYETEIGYRLLPIPGDTEPIQGVAYFYADIVRIWVTIGAALTTIGILVILSKRSQ